MGQDQPSFTGRRRGQDHPGLTRPHTPPRTHHILGLHDKRLSSRPRLTLCWPTPLIQAHPRGASEPDGALLLCPGLLRGGAQKNKQKTKYIIKRRLFCAGSNGMIEQRPTWSENNMGGGKGCPTKSKNDRCGNSRCVRRVRVRECVCRHSLGLWSPAMWRRCSPTAYARLVITNTLVAIFNASPSTSTSTSPLGFNYVSFFFFFFFFFFFLSF